MEVRNRFKGLNLIDRVSEELWMDRGSSHHDQTRAQDKELQKGKIVV